MEIIKIGILILIVILPFLYIGRAAFKLQQDFPKMSEVWNKLKDFDKYSVKIGLVLIIPVPALKTSTFHEEYIVALIIEILPALATGFFVNGVIAYAKAMHNFNKQKL